MHSYLYRRSVRRSKTDQEGEGGQEWRCPTDHTETCPVRSLNRWLELSGVSIGPVFRAVDKSGRVASTRLSDRSVVLVIRRAADRARLDAESFSGHSLRAGLATAAAAAGVSEHDIARTTGRRSVSVLRRYVRAATAFERNAASSVGL